MAANMTSKANLLPETDLGYSLGSSNLKWKINGLNGQVIPFIIGTGSTAGTWLGELAGLTAYYDGLIILYKIPIAGADTTTLNLNNLGAKTVYLNNTTKLTTHYPINQPILLIYSANTNNGCWTASDYNSNTTYSVMSAAEMTTGTATSNRVMRAANIKSALTQIITTGTTNGTIKVYNTEVPVAGLGDRAFDSTTYLPLSGGTMTGAISWASNSLTQFSSSPTYLLGIEAFADGGTTKWRKASETNVGSATALQTARTIWGQSFNGTANISGNLIDAGPQIKLPSGQTIFSFLKSDNTAPSAHFGRLGLADSYSNINLTDFRFDVHGNGRFTRSLQAGGTDTTDEQQIDLYGPAGLIYMYSQGSTTGNRGLYGKNSNGTYGNIFSIDQNNDTCFFGSQNMLLNTNGIWKQNLDSNHTIFCSRQPGTDAFGQCAIEIRETGLVGNAQSSMDYAPKLGFHWGQRCAGFIALNSSNWFDFKNQANNGYKGINVGGLTCYGSTISVRVPGVDASQANNNVTSTQYPTSFNILDDSGRILTRQECVLVANNGEIRSYWYVRNYDTSGSQLYQAGICLYGYKDGTRKAVSELQFYGAVWNDYAEYRQSDELEPGRCIIENGDGTLSRSTKRLQKGCEIVSDTFGFAIGQSNTCKTPTAATGRVLAYLLESKEEAKKNIGQAVCSGTNGTVSIMTDEECRLWPQCIIGTISEIPDYEIWHAGTQTGNKTEEIQVNGRIWIRIR